jgi:hypothetical protein
MEIPVLPDELAEKLRRAEYLPAVRTEQPSKLPKIRDGSNSSSSTNTFSEKLFKLPEQPSRDKLDRKNSKRNINVNTNDTNPSKSRPQTPIASPLATPSQTPIQSPHVTPSHNITTPSQNRSIRDIIQTEAPVNRPSQTPKQINHASSANNTPVNNTLVTSTPAHNVPQTPTKVTKVVEPQTESISPERAKLRKMVELAKERKRKRQALEAQQREIRKRAEELKKEVSGWMQEEELDQVSCHGIGFNQKIKYRSEPTTISDVILIIRDMFGEDNMNKVIKEVDILHTKKNANNYEIKFSFVDDEAKKEKPKKTTKATKETSPKTTMTLKKRKLVLD